MRCKICDYSRSVRDGHMEYYSTHNRVLDSGVCWDCELMISYNGGTGTYLEELEYMFANAEEEQEKTIEQLNKEAATVSEKGLPK